MGLSMFVFKSFVNGNIRQASTEIELMMIWDSGLDRYLSRYQNGMFQIHMLLSVEI
jgi:hypothetical protein